MTPVQLLTAWLTPRLEAAARAWLEDALARLRTESTEHDLYLRVSQVSRRLGKMPLAPSVDELQAAAASRPGWDPRDWTVDNAARVLLLLASSADGAELGRRLDKLC
ncbi:MAG: hypothetical protein NDI84_18220, partial [Steroidobacteraceae bacterium]|nr:hypothetical protein [Steroidobacteraceae bacterium]